MAMDEISCGNCTKLEIELIEFKKKYAELEAHHIKETTELYEMAKALKDPTQYPMTSVCSVCDVNLGVKPGGDKPGRISHGLCKDPECKELFQQGKKKPK